MKYYEKESHKVERLAEGRAEKVARAGAGLDPDPPICQLMTARSHRVVTNFTDQWFLPPAPVPPAAPGPGSCPTGASPVPLLSCFSKLHL